MFPHFGGSPAAGALDEMVAAAWRFQGLRLTLSLPGILRTADSLLWPVSPQWTGCCPLVPTRGTNKRLENPDFAETSRQSNAQAQTVVVACREVVYERRRQETIRRKPPPILQGAALVPRHSAFDDCNARKTVVIVAVSSRTPPTRHSFKRDEAPDGSPGSQRRGRLGWVAFPLGRARAGNPGPRRGRRSKRWLRGCQVFLFKALAPCD